MSVDGDTAVVTLHSGTPDPTGLRRRLDGLGVGVDRVARGFTAPERDAHATAGRQREATARTRLAQGEGREESICGSDQKTDAACYRATNPVPYLRSKAVARLLINGVELCSAWRVGPNNRMFTNHHCFTDSYSARNTEVWFNYECAVCGGYEVLRSTKVWGDQVLATDQRLDYTLFTVQDFDSIARFGYLQLDVRAPRRGEELYIPQHPGGDPTKIAIDSPFEKNGNCKVVDPSYWGYDYGTDLSYYCDTEGGSSGSPVLSRNTNEVIGLHHFGGCPNSAVRIDLIYRKIADLL
jgi:lysyl endopeptidase